MTTRTPGPWALRGYQIRADNGRGMHVATYQTNGADGRLLAAAPELLDLLNDACGSLDAAERSSASHTTADRIRQRMGDLGLWTLRGTKAYPYGDARVLPARLDGEPATCHCGKPLLAGHVTCGDFMCA